MLKGRKWNKGESREYFLWPRNSLCTKVLNIYTIIHLCLKRDNVNPLIWVRLRSGSGTKCSLNTRVPFIIRSLVCPTQNVNLESVSARVPHRWNHWFKISGPAWRPPFNSSEVLECRLQREKEMVDVCNGTDRILFFVIHPKLFHAETELQR